MVGAPPTERQKDKGGKAKDARGGKAKDARSADIGQGVIFDELHNVHVASLINKNRAKATKLKWRGIPVHYQILPCSKSY